MAARGWWRVAVLGAVGVALAAAPLTACGDEEAKTCTERSGATFCLQRQGASGLEPSAEGLLPGSTVACGVSGFGPEGEPFTSGVGPDGRPDRSGVVGVLSATEVFDPTTAEVVFTGTAADGTPVTATLTLGG